MPLDRLRVILNKPRFPENIGMTARACANMGCDYLAIVCPELWKKTAVYALATPKGKKVVDACEFYPDLRSALASSRKAFAATARIGGWRKRVLSPEACAEEVVALLEQGKSVSLVFGPEDKGLTNDEIAECGNIVSIPSRGEAASLNLAQSALIILYECAKLRDRRPRVARPTAKDDVNLREINLLEKELKEALELLDCLHGKNPDYYFTQWRRILERANLNRKEFSSFMGLCRQIKNKINKDRQCPECDITKKR